MTNPENIPTSDLITITGDVHAVNRIDDPANMAGDRVYIFHGTADDVVAFGKFTAYLVHLPMNLKHHRCTMSWKSSVPKQLRTTVDSKVQIAVHFVIFVS